MENHTRTRLLEPQTEAVEALMNSIPEHFFANPDTLFLDPAMGGGQYLAGIVRRCEKYHSRDQILPRIYGVESKPWFINRAVLYNNLNGANFSSDINSVAHMKFKVIVSNPPYSLPKGQKKVSDGSKNLSLKFIEKAVSLLEDDGFISMLTPLNFLKPTDNKKPTKSFSVLNGVNLSSVTTGIGPKWFPGIGCNICMWTADKKDSGMTLNGENWDLSEIPFVVDLEGDYLKLFKRVWKHMKTGGEGVTVKRVGDGGKTAEEGWSLTERMNRRKLSETLWSETPEREKLEQIHISLPPAEANKLFSQPHIQFFMRATDVEPTLYHNLLNGLHFGPIKLSAREAALAMEKV